MIRIVQLKMPITHTEEELKSRIAKKLRIEEKRIEGFEVVRQSIDARDKKELKFVYTVDVTLKQEEKIVKRAKDINIFLTEKHPYICPVTGSKTLSHPPVVVGSGPAGLFCAYQLALAGLRPIILERGDEAAKRKKKVDEFWSTGRLDLSSNVQFGEGGAGTFSDGKLNTLVKDSLGRNQKVLEVFVEAGAPSSILYMQKPHLGTDLLIQIVEHMRQMITDLGGTFRFRTCLTDLLLEDGQLCAVEVNHKEQIPTKVCVLAIGHSARDTFSLLEDRGIDMEAKSFAVGVRIEHPQRMINLSQYGMEESQILGAASYKLTHKLKSGRGIYSFCMCPGGYVVNASSEEGHLAVNGMSYHARAGQNANSAMIVTVTPQDFGQPGALGGIAFQRKLESAAYALESGRVPVQLFQDFRLNKKSTALGEIIPCIKGAYALSNVRSLLPPFLADSLEEGILAFDKKIPGFAREDALLSGIESRTSSPVRIRRDEGLECSAKGIYPCGEGAGYAGGITSAAMDGLKTAEAILKKYRNLE